LPILKIFTELFENLQGDCGNDASQLQSQSSTIKEARKQFIFDSHQQSADKCLVGVVNEVNLTIKNRFNTEELVDRLHSVELSPKEKIETWEELKFRSVAKIVSVSYVYPLLSVAFKLHRSILSHELCNEQQCSKSRDDSEGLIKYITNIFAKAQDPESTNTISSQKIQQIFNNCIHFLANDGVDRLLNLIEQLTKETIEGIKLTESVDTNSFRLLIEKIGSNLESFTGDKNFSDIVIPSSQISNSDCQMTYLKKLFMQLTSALQSKTCKNIMKTFTRQYFDHVSEFLDQTLEKSIPFAKLIPMLTKAYTKVSLDKHGSVFHQTLNSTELYQLTLILFNSASEILTFE